MKANYSKNDSVYLSPSVFNEPKEYFKIIMKILSPNIKKHGRKQLAILDAGCASGAFLHYFKTIVPTAACVGIEISEKHLKLAAKMVPQAHFFLRSLISAPMANQRKRFDIVTCLGTLCIFRDILKPLKSMAKYLKPGGVLVIYDLINNDPIDVMEQHRIVKSHSSRKWSSTFNVRSKETWRNSILKALPRAHIRFIDFRLPFALKKTDPMRAWTIRTESNPFQVTVGTGQLLNFNLIIVRDSNLVKSITKKSTN